MNDSARLFRYDTFTLYSIFIYLFFFPAFTPLIHTHVQSFARTAPRYRIGSVVVCRAQFTFRASYPKAKQTNVRFDECVFHNFAVATFSLFLFDRFCCLFPLQKQFIWKTINEITCADECDKIFS